MALLGLATWALTHSYLGIFHDAGLYTLQALARLHPQSLLADAFLKFGSQDRFTLFSPLYATAARWLGVESAAAWLTFAFQMALLGAAWVLARTAMPPAMALLGLGVLIGAPGDYGPDRIFTCMESFLTPRMAAEALVLLGLAAALRGAKGGSAVLMTAAALLHPIMAMAGVCALYWLHLGERRPVAALLLAIGALAALALGSFTMPFGPLGRFDPDWWVLVRNRSPYLFLDSWTVDDLARAAVTLGTLLTATRIVPSPRVRTLCRIVLMTCASGLALTFIGCDQLHLVTVTQLQPWRWLWLGSLTAVLMLPDILRILFGGERAGQTTGALLLAAWIFGSTPYALTATVAALASLAAAQRLRGNEIRWVHLGAFGMLAIAVLWRLASNLEFTESHYLDHHLPGWLRRAMSFTHDGSVPAAVFAAVWWLARRAAAHMEQAAGQVRRMELAAAGSLSIRVGLASAGLLICAGCAALLPHTWNSWTTRDYPQPRIEQFAVMRQRIPEGAEVFWPELPVGTWLLLHRPSYISVIQTSGLVYSRPAARELERRAQALRSVMAPSAFLSWQSAGTGMNLSRQQLLDACRTGEFAFLVSHFDLGAAPLATVASGPGAPGAPGALRLYRCQVGPG